MSRIGNWFHVNDNSSKIMTKPSSSVLSREARSMSMLGYGMSAYGCPEGIPIEQALFGILAAFGASFGVLFRAVTQATQKRKKRGTKEDIVEDIGMVEVMEDLRHGFRIGT